ncbi:ATP-dependent RNA helicase p47, putative [Trichomonas vaginalis G3]|uniref:RNA helicase n=1 Tax=Trichomonas vaginalis (strain ATCC PRA-98 / G3) TaxID=412133 RepID=A2F468_TRIV3|nr:ATP-dependent RNA helicase DBP3 family [Trichomonas vaginalis G3]EAY00315.1 ATP-dependent RNA helicase p47, putative [Trichomonas vaginalis G3]KAI5490888.1 ATP-dependent RNA helicase DBP3 family [Trichomonas vaginalis G3]|eukprot:XP_001313244.1 ATP-dependent RNA helicase p47 [Trichomonas vaginalis G3]
MADPLDAELLNYEDDSTVDAAPHKEKEQRGHYVGVHTTGFREFLLKPELMHAISDCGFEHPSQVQQECIPHALLGTDIICQGKSGMGKTAVFVISVLQQLDPVPGEVSCLTIAPTRELAFQIATEFQRFTKFMPGVDSVVFYGGIPKATNIATLKEKKPCIVVATPGRCLDLIKEKDVLDVSKVKFFVIDEADKVFEKQDMKDTVDKIYNRLPKDKQVLLFSATMPDSMKEICRSFTHNATEVYVDDDKKLTLHGLQQYYVKLAENEKNRKLVEILENYKFNQVVIFLDKKERAKNLTQLLNECGHPTIAISGNMTQEDRIRAFSEFKQFKHRILVATDLIARGIDVERVNIVINYDMPDSTDTYLHRVGRAGRFGTKGLAISFVVTEEDVAMQKKIQDRFELKIEQLPASIAPDTYMNA